MITIGIINKNDMRVTDIFSIFLTKYANNKNAINIIITQYILLIQ